ncbi:MAG: hypothetical protein HQK76_20885 [Desulfobacterales bacterium]|nr:hypothetical protein [Desulfobacterales bacterium]
MSDTELPEFEEIFGGEDNRPEVKLLFSNIKNKLPELAQLLAECCDHWEYEDLVYRFYHQSFKVYGLQQRTKQIVDNLQSLLPNCELNEWFVLIVNEGTGKEFKKEDNRQWLKVTRPILEGFFHAKYFLEMAVKYGNELEYPPRMLPSGWASLLYLYNLR